MCAKERRSRKLSRVHFEDTTPNVYRRCHSYCQAARMSSSTSPVTTWRNAL